MNEGNLPMPGGLGQMAAQPFIDGYVEMVRAVVEAAKREGIFEELDNNPEFQKSWKEYLASEKGSNGLQATNEALTNDLMSVLLQDELGYRSDQEYTWQEDDLWGMTDDVLRRAGQTEGPRLIKNLRRLQLAEFGQVETPEGPGIKLKHVDPDEKVPQSEKKEMMKWARVIAEKLCYVGHCVQPNFAQFLGNWYEDFFDLDKVAVEIRRDRSGRPLGLHLIDPSLVKPIIPRKKRLWERWDQEEYDSDMKEAGKDEGYEDDYRFLLVKDGKRLAKFRKDRMYVATFFTTTYIKRAYRGMGIMEQGIRIVTHIVNAMVLNASRLTRNRAPFGILVMEGGANVDRATLEMFKKLLWAQTTGAVNRWRIPVIGLPKGDKAQWIPFHQASKEMEYYQWMSLLFTILCQLSGTDPTELALASNKEAIGRRPMFEQGPNTIIRSSKDKGLRTFLYAVARAINNTGVIQEITGHPEWVLEFTGLDVRDEKAMAELHQSELGSIKSMNQLLSENDLETIDEDWADVPGIGNPQILQAWTQSKQMEMGQQMGGFGGQMPGAEGEEGGEGGFPMPPGEGEEAEEATPGEEKTGLEFQSVNKSAAGMNESGLDVNKSIAGENLDDEILLEITLED